MDEALLAVVVFERVGRPAGLGQEREVGMLVQRALYKDSGEGPGGKAGMRMKASE